jgi:prepilin-type N-terminal cleavage/methylation domain-containing protein
MVYQIRSKKRGFSLVEIVVVLGIITLFVGISTTVYTTIKSSNNLEVGTNSIVGALRLAKRYAEQVNSDTKWGVYINSSQVTIFSGSSYAGRDTNKDKPLLLPSGLTTSGLDEIVFEKSSGITSTIGSITITGSDSIKNISINEKGTITY